MIDGALIPADGIADSAADVISFSRMTSGCFLPAAPFRYDQRKPVCFVVPAVRFVRFVPRRPVVHPVCASARYPAGTALLRSLY
ncbi:hypothetical protein UA45_19790 [Morganella morganii]|uniref:Uncharacterized protein n=1 Tax=Morganella morganii TaxID=582 RepID=A0A0D8L2S0_MORMO|nr:hypothetical protein UA45_19790 [Morganella morganii]